MVGTKMLIRPNGDTDGTGGGGCGEAEVWRTALDVMADREARMVTVDLTEEIALDTDGVCGGIMEIFVEPWAPGTDGGSRALVRGLLGAVEAKQPAVTVTVVWPDRTGAMRIGREAAGGGWHAGCRRPRLDVASGAGAGRPTGRAGRRPFADPVVCVRGRAERPGRRAHAIRAHRRAGPRLPSHVPRRCHLPTTRVTSAGRERGAVSVFFELTLPKPVLVVVGAGHVAVPVAEVGRLLDFEVVVIDDRPSFANVARFPMADRLIVDDFEAALDALPITPSTFIVLVTRGHAHDVRLAAPDRREAGGRTSG